MFLFVVSLPSFLSSMYCLSSTTEVAPVRRNTGSTNLQICAMGVFRSQSPRALISLFKSTFTGHSVRLFFLYSFQGCKNALSLGHDILATLLISIVSSLPDISIARYYLTSLIQSQVHSLLSFFSPLLKHSFFDSLLLSVIQNMATFFFSVLQLMLKEFFCIFRLSSFFTSRKQFFRCDLILTNPLKSICIKAKCNW